jgi:peptide/nickel transport system ATP-binding protein
MAFLEIDRVSLTLPGRAERPLLDDVSLQVAAGEMVGLVGESGSGKSVTARSVLGLWPDGAQVEGAVRVGGRDVLAVSTEEMLALRRSEVSMIFQDPRSGINPIRRVGDFLTESLRLNHGWSGDRARGRAVELLHAVGLEDAERHLRQYPHELSGGMLQRVMIAGALTVEPQLLLCDEPTTALDVITQAEILGILKRLQVSTGTGVLFITHDLDLAAAVCDRVYVMYAGRIVESASAAAVFGAPRHPYTAGLLGSTPDLSGAHGRLIPIAGSPLSLLERPSGCAFSGRCSYAVEGRCDVEVPELVDAGGHAVRCLRSVELAAELALLSTPEGGTTP